MSVFENVAFGLRRAGCGGRDPARGRRRARPGAARRARPTACRSSSPAGSSSAWRSPAPSSTEPRLLLLDEPLSNLDALAARGDAGRAQAPAAATRHHHPVRHARPGGGAVALRPGRILDRGGSSRSARPRRSTTARATPFVASFIGRSNLLAATVGGQCRRRAELRVGGGSRAGRAAPVPLRQGDTCRRRCARRHSPGPAATPGRRTLHGARSSSHPSPAPVGAICRPPRRRASS